MPHSKNQLSTREDAQPVAWDGRGKCDCSDDTGLCHRCFPDPPSAATREEAPAEAGEREAIAAILKRRLANNPSQESFDLAVDDLIALRAQPLAPDAQAVAWAIRYAGDSNKAPLAQVTMSEEFAGMMKHQGHEVIALGPITHPAPDALRIAVAKLEKAKITDDPAEVFMLAMEALAALQAEQEPKGG